MVLRRRWMAFSGSGRLRPAPVNNTTGVRLLCETAVPAAAPRRRLGVCGHSALQSPAESPRRRPGLYACHASLALVHKINRPWLSLPATSIQLPGSVSHGGAEPWPSRPSPEMRPAIPGSGRGSAAPCHESAPAAANCSRDPTSSVTPRKRPSVTQRRRLSGAAGRSGRGSGWHRPPV